MTLYRPRYPGLSRDEHFALMEALLQLLRERESETLVLPAAWEQELDRRDAALDAGEMEVSTWEEVRKRVVGLGVPRLK